MTVIMRNTIKIVIIVFILTALLIGIEQKTDSTRFSNEILAKDITLTILALSAKQGDAVLDYSQDLSNKTVEIEKGKVSVHEIGKEVAKVTIPFIESETIKITYAKFKPDETGKLNLRFIKSGNLIRITDDLSVKPETLELTCPSFSTKDINWQNKEVLIDVAHRDNDNDLGYTFDSFVEAEIVEKIASYFKTQRIKLTREAGVAMVGKREDKITDDTEIIISLNVGGYEGKINELRAYIDPAGIKNKESNKLACLILNAIRESDTLQDIPLNAVKIIPLKEDDPGYGIIKAGNDKIALSLEIGNINHEEGREMLTRTSDIGKAIYQGLFNYYI